jgi:hypothetical protein
MRKAAVVLGILGGLYALVTLGLVSSGGHGIATGRLWLLPAGILGVVGGGLAIRYTWPPVILLLVGAVLGFFGMRVFWVPGCVLLLVAAGLLLGSNRRRPQPAEG